MHGLFNIRLGSRRSSRGKIPGVASNAGPATVTGYLWQYLVGSTWTDLPATNDASTYVTVTPRDVGRVISCLLTVTNDHGSTQMRSTSSSALT